MSHSTQPLADLEFLQGGGDFGNPSERGGLGLRENEI